MESTELEANDPIHRVRNRLMIRTNSAFGFRLVNTELGIVEEPSTNVRYQSLISDQIGFIFPNRRGLLIYGPPTQYFRIPVLVGENVMFRIDVVYDKQEVRILNQPASCLRSTSSETPLILKVAHACQLIDMVFLAPDGSVARSSSTARLVNLGQRSARLDAIFPFTEHDMASDDIINANPRPDMVSR